MGGSSGIRAAASSSSPATGGLCSLTGAHSGVSGRLPWVAPPPCLRRRTKPLSVTTTAASPSSTSEQTPKESSRARRPAASRLPASARTDKHSQPGPTTAPSGSGTCAPGRCARRSRAIRLRCGPQRSARTAGLCTPQATTAASSPGTCQATVASESRSSTRTAPAVFRPGRT